MGYSAEIISCLVEEGKQTPVGKFICEPETMKKVNLAFNDCPNLKEYLSKNFFYFTNSKYKNWKEFKY